ncbi:MAG TPA: glycoside hydrolase family 2 TIM barrel-domain containing protein [Opitutaceae bacterium]
MRASLVLLAGLAATGPVNLAGAVEPTTDRVYLSGRGSDDAVEWEFFCSEGRRSGEWATIPVPSCWELQGFGTYQYGIGYYGKPRPPGIAREQGKYRHAFNVPAEWSGKRVQIVFEGVMTDAAVTVNGASAGPKHQGGFYRFRNDITDLLKYGAENVLEVTVDKESADDSVNLAERRADYWNFGGIFRPVFLEVRPARFIARTAIDAQADGHFRADIFLGNAAAPQTEVVAQIVDAAGQAVGKEFSAGTRAGDDRVTVATRIDGPRQWTAETPALYLVRFMLREKGEVRHIVTERFGFRTFEVRASDGLYLNGRRILLKGVNRHSFWPETGRTLSRERNYADVRLMKELNLNAVRMSHYPPDPEFLDACDELGLYVLDELGGWHGRYDEGVGRKLVAGLVQRDVNHPSIIFWDNGNEGGWNVALDGEFARWDPQQRPVLHPQQTLSGIDTMHYRSYGETQEYLRQPEIFMPTEFLHRLYDGGHGAGL